VTKQAGGWLLEEFPPYNTVNWMWNRLTQWVQHAGDVASRFESPEEAIEVGVASPFPLQGTCLIPGDEADIPGTAHTADAFGLGSGAQAIAATGRSIVAQLGEPDDAPATGDIRSFRRDGSGTAIATYLLGAGHVPHLLADGIHVAFSLGNTLHVHDHDTGALVFSQALGGGTINDIAWDEAFIYVAGTFLGQQLKRINRLTGATVWGFDHNAALESVAVYGDQVFVAGAASGHVSGATLRSVRASDGFDNSGEGGNGTDALQFDKIQATLSTLPRMLAADGRGLYVGQGQEVDVRSLAGGDVIASMTSPPFSDDIRSVKIDHERLFVATSDRVFPGPGQGGALHVFDRDTLAQVWRYRDAPLDHRIHDIATDGHALFVAQPIGAANVAPRLFRGTRTGWWQRVDPSAAGARAIGALRQLLIPITRA